jgi:predicted Fe-Mo cluster-binding NifX family protein
MRVVITADGTELEARVNPRFGHCPYYVFVDMETGEHEAQPNPVIDEGGAVGVEAAHFVIEQGVEAVITVNVGAGPFERLAAADIPVYQAAGMTVGKAVEAFTAGLLTTATGAVGAGHPYVRPAGTRRDDTLPTAPTPPPLRTRREEIEALKQEITALQQKVAELNEKLETLNQEQ